MALWLETDTNTNKDINAATSVGVYTATGDVFVLPQVLADQVAGGGDYVYHVTLQVAGAGSHFVIGPKTTHTAAAGETALGAQGGLIFIRSGDVLTVYVDGLAGDTTTPDVTVRFAAIPLPAVAPGAIGGLPVLDANLAASANVTYLAGQSDPVDNLVLALGKTEGIVAYPQGIADALKLAPTAGDPAAGSVNKHLDDILEDTGTTLPGLLSGAGSTAYTDTVTDDSSNPLDGVEVWITSDSGGASTVASTTTSTLGTFTVYLDPGTYYLWCARGDINFPNPTAITVT